MYLLEGMIRIGQPKKWKSAKHRQVAINLGIANPAVRTASVLKAVCQSVNSVPVARIKTVTYRELRDEFELPAVGCD